MAHWNRVKVCVSDMPDRTIKGLLLGMMLSLPAGVMADDPSIGDERKAELRHLLKQDCGSCHGLTLQGGLGPAITAEALAEKSRATMATIILYGRPGTPMPPWSSILTEDEVEWMVDILFEEDQP